jgi:hypothetical protein
MTNLAERNFSDLMSEMGIRLKMLDALFIGDWAEYHRLDKTIQALREAHFNRLTNAKNVDTVQPDLKD